MTMAIFTHRELIANLIQRDIVTRYRRSFFGILWALLEPLGMMAVLVTVFSVIIRLDVPDYPLFLLVGLLPWEYFSATTSRGGGAIIANAGLIKKIYFPREIFPLTVTAARLVNFLISLLILIPFFLVYHRPVLSPALLALPLVIALQTAFAYYVALALSTMNVFYEDVSFLFDFLLKFWFYGTPVIYPLSLAMEHLPQPWSTLYLLNPMTVFVSAYRDILLGRIWPRWDLLALAAGVVLVTGLLSTMLFRRLEGRLGEVL
jgi:lipopolysaccharide transport system permease protein